MKNEIAIAGMFFITLITRAGFMLFNKQLKLDNTWKYILRLAPSVALCSTIVLDVFVIQNKFIGVTHNLRLLAVVSCIIAFIWFKKIWLSLVIGITAWALLISFFV